VSGHTERRLRPDYDGLMQRAYIGSTRALSVVLILLGLLLIVSATVS
jgi:hypothetical protein